MIPEAHNQAEIVRLLARIGTLEQLLEVYERSVVEQSDRLYAEQERMRLQKTLLECQGEASLDGILSLSADGVVLFANRRLGELWDIPPPAAGTKRAEALLRAMARQTTDPEGFLARTVRIDDGEEGRAEVVLDDGRTFDAYTAPIRSQEGRHLGRVWSFRDISAYREVTRLKDEFIASVSHELRTPLTSILGSLGLVVAGTTGELPEETNELLRVAQSNCERLVRLINDVLDIEKIEAGRMDFSLEILELAPLLERSVTSMESYGRRYGVSFRLTDQAPGARVRAHTDRLLQVLENLLSNAAKFSPEGETVDVLVTRQRGRVRVCVRDRGPGVPAALRDRLFEKFSHGGASGSRQRQGTGLGLSIARAIVQRLGGSIDFDSRPGETTFRIDLPEWRAGEDATA